MRRLILAAVIGLGTFGIAGTAQAARPLVRAAGAPPLPHAYFYGPPVVYAPAPVYGSAYVCGLSTCAGRLSQQQRFVLRTKFRATVRVLSRGRKFRLVSACKVERGIDSASSRIKCRRKAKRLFAAGLRFGRGRAKLFAGGFHLLFEFRAGLFPHGAANGHRTAPFGFAVVEAGGFAAASLVFAIVHGGTIVLHRGAIAQACRNRSLHLPPSLCIRLSHGRHESRRQLQLMCLRRQRPTRPPLICRQNLRPDFSRIRSL